MGKKLIIKGADFSESAVQPEISWYTNFEPYIGSITMNVFVHWGYSISTSANNLAGKPINIIKIWCKSDAPTGTFAVRKIINGVVSMVCEFNFTNDDSSAGYKIIPLGQTILLGNNDNIIVGQVNTSSESKAPIGYAPGVNTRGDCLYYDGSSMQSLGSSVSVGIDYGILE